MGQVFVWRPEGAPMQQAVERFHQVLEHQRSLYDASFGRRYTLRRQRVGRVLIAEIATDMGIRGWQSWTCEDGRGVAWSGVCEDHLDRTWTRDALERFVDTVLDAPEAMAEWQGAYSLIAWDEGRERVVVASGTTQSQTLWRTEGAGGWAIGSRARPLLDLVQRSPSLDATQATLFLSYGYLAGRGHLFEHVHRVPAASRVEVPAHGAPSVEPIVPLAEFLASGATAGMEESAVLAHCAEAFRQRVARQMRHSRTPELSLTGGHDSRAIAAALAASGFGGPASTGGVDDSPDVQIARRVATSLGIEHHRNSGTTDALERLSKDYGRALLWSRLNEGVETIRHALYFGSFFEEARPFARPVNQKFNGLRPFLNRRSSPNYQRDAIEGKVRDDLLHAEAARRHVREFSQEFAEIVARAGGGSSHWADLHFWRVHVLHSGQDNMASKDLFSWWWTPLVDKHLIRANWAIDTSHGDQARFVDGLTSALAPQLRSIPYAGSETRGPLRKLLKRIRRRLPGALRPDHPHTFAVSSERRSLWEWFLFEREGGVWRDLVDEGRVRRVLDGNVRAHLLWSIATIELFYEAHCTVTPETDVASLVSRLSRTA